MSPYQKYRYSKIFLKTGKFLIIIKSQIPTGGQWNWKIIDLEYL